MPSHTRAPCNLLKSGKPPNVGKTPVFEDCDIEVRDRLSYGNWNNLAVGPSCLIEIDYLPPAHRVFPHTSRAFAIIDTEIRHTWKSDEHMETF